MNESITNGRITRWLLLLQEFNINILDRIGKQNTFVDFLSRIQNDNNDVLVEDNFPDEYPFAVSTKTPWFKDIANYLDNGKLPPQLSAREKQDVIKTSAPYSWINGDLYKNGPNFII